MSSAAQPVPATTEDDEPDRSLAGVHASAEFDRPVEEVWLHLISDRGTEALLGPGVTLGSKGESWHSDDGPHADGPLSVVDVQLRQNGGGTRVDVYHEGEGIAEDGAGDKRRWDDALGRLGSSLGA